ncbi:MAG: DUF983 domain-containing protein [Rhodospirillaceae bacterium]|nr:DUF983 domain-containing protein [Rhodospirillaceae bacterium]
MAEITRPTVPLSTVALKCCCPRCGEGKLFDGFLTIAKTCNVCGLSFEGHDTGDGPAFFVMLPLCLVIAGLALWVDTAFDVPRLFHLIFWPIFIIGISLIFLRPIKAVMVAQQYKHRDVETYDQSAQQ